MLNKVSSSLRVSMSCNNTVRYKRRPKGILLKIEDYQPKPVYEREGFVYYGASNGQGKMQRYVKKSCVYCGGAVSFVGIIERKGVKLVERYCSDHAKTHGPITPMKLKVVHY